jgi:hypothetical protein
VKKMLSDVEEGLQDGEVSLIMMVSKNFLEKDVPYDEA